MLYYNPHCIQFFINQIFVFFEHFEIVIQRFQIQ